MKASTACVYGDAHAHTRLADGAALLNFQIKELFSLLFANPVFKEATNLAIIAFFGLAYNDGTLLECMRFRFFVLNEPMKGKLFLISGPSGVGKGTVISALKRQYPQFVYPISHTTRAMRPSEKDGEVYHFLDKADFEAEVEKGNFLEWARVHGENCYGTLKQPIMEALEQGKVVVREVDVQGFHSIRKVIPRENLVTIFLKAENLEKLIERITKRGKLPEEEIQRRMQSAERELSDAQLFDYQVWSLEGKVSECVSEVEKIIADEITKAGLKI